MGTKSCDLKFYRQKIEGKFKGTKTKS